jgi:hypothetical protein
MSERWIEALNRSHRARRQKTASVRHRLGEVKAHVTNHLPIRATPIAMRAFAFGAENGLPEVNAY